MFPAVVSGAALLTSCDALWSPFWLAYMYDLCAFLRHATIIVETSSPPRDIFAYAVDYRDGCYKSGKPDRVSALLSSIASVE